MLKFVFMFSLFLGIWHYNFKKKSSWKTPSSFLLGIYVMSSFCGIWAINVLGFKEPLSSSYWIPVVEFSAFLLAFLYPVISYREDRIERINLPSLNTLNVFSTVIIILSFLSIVHYASTVNMIFALSSLSDARSMLYAGEEFVESGLINTIASVSASMYVFALLLFFIYSSIGGHNKRCILLLISSISEPLHVLCYVGRDGIVFWIFSFLMLFLFFKPYMGDATYKKVRKSFIIGSSALLIPFMLISISRFDASDGGTGGSMISYLGQGFVNGPLFFGIEHKPISGATGFPLFWEMTGLNPPKSMGMIQYGEWLSWNFSTFVVDFYRYFGFGGEILVCILLSLVFKMIFNRLSRDIAFNKLFVYILYFQILSQGVFYFRQYTRGGNLFIVICIVFYFAFIQNSQKMGIVLRKQK